jgi:redox-sensitive bicupin YhaK (pirin superfamily)
MIDIRPFSSLGKATFGWLDANHHFSFGHYRNPDRDQWGPAARVE